MWRDVRDDVANCGPVCFRLSTDRLPPIDASQALEQLNSVHSACISSGVELLDAVLQTAPEAAHGGGIRRGQVTEIWGPPGSGRTAMGYVMLDVNGIGTRTLTLVLAFS